MEKCLLYLFSTGSQFLYCIYWMGFDLFFYCVTVKTIYTLNQTRWNTWIPTTMKDLKITSSDGKNGKEQEKEDKSVDEKAILTFIFIFTSSIKLKMNVSIAFSSTLLFSFSCSFPFLSSLEVTKRRLSMARFLWRSFHKSRHKYNNDFKWKSEDIITRITIIIYNYTT